VIGSRKTTSLTHPAVLDFPFSKFFWFCDPWRPVAIFWYGPDVCGPGLEGPEWAVDYGSSGGHTGLPESCRSRISSIHELSFERVVQFHQKQASLLGERRVSL
jgi:hypothetical protein